MNTQSNDCVLQTRKLNPRAAQWFVQRDTVHRRPGAELRPERKLFYYLPIFTLEKADAGLKNFNMRK